MKTSLVSIHPNFYEMEKQGWGEASWVKGKDKGECLLTLYSSSILLVEVSLGFSVLPHPVHLIPILKDMCLSANIDSLKSLCGFGKKNCDVVRLSRLALFWLHS